MNKSGNSLNLTNYKPTDSQEQLLQTSPFAGQSEFLSSSGGQSSSDDVELLTGIVMVSVSESSQDYQTPPENHSRSQNSSNDGHVRPPVDLEVKTDGVGDLKSDDDSEPHGENIVDLTNDSDHDLGFTEETHVVHAVEDDDNDSPLIEKDDDTEQIETGDCAVTEPFETDLVSGSQSVENADKVFDQMPKRGDVASTRATTAGKRKFAVYNGLKRAN